MTLGRNEIDVSLSAPEDDVSAAAHAVLAGDRVIADYVGGERNVLLCDVPPPPDFRPGKRMYVFPAFTGEPTLAPGKDESRPVRVVTRIRRNLRNWEPSRRGVKTGGWPIAVPGLATITNRIFLAIYEAKGLPQTINGQEVDIVSPGRTRAEPTTWEWQTTEDGSVFALNFDTALTFEVRIDHDQGRIYNVVKAGG